MPYALITGSSKGIGKAIAIELAKRKVNVLLVARSSTLLQQLAEEITSKYSVKADYLALDLSLNNAAETVYNWCTEKQYAVNILVNNAGYGLSGDFDDIPLEKINNMLQLNMMAVAQFCHIFLPQLKKHPQSYILNVASSAAYQAVPFLALYSASKAFVLSFSRALSYELKDTTVSVTCISPGPTDTDFPQRAELNEKAKKAATKYNMAPEAVAAIAVRAMFAGKLEVIPGFINKLAAFLVWIAPKRVTETTAAAIYK